ncbi:DMT family transporter [Pelagerythrobacter rhizovicinus]|uniref:DMT family transporter n=1 Tax=Pelagerythrobacter rhizovicinus TaxID=2268576 RepID=A0A4Q2KPI1_9SPHN|nr:DMT family transporter [Pelagerythrobacter rhizovicinus]RXZ65413.1 DMT family transporter [Pelagerythrobacter rhizovicinus]
MPLRDFLILVGVCLVWALNVVVSKFAVGPFEIPPVFFAGIRSALVAIVLLPWLRPLPAPLGRTVLVALLLGGASFALLFIGLRTATASSAAIVSLASAPAAVLFAIALLGERVRWRRALGILLALVGIGIVLVGQGRLSASLGLLVVAISALAGALGSVLLKKLSISPMRLQAWSGLSGMILLLPLSAITESGQIAATASAGWNFVAVLLFSALVVSVGAHTVYFWLLSRHDVNVIAPLTLMNPLLTVALGALLVQEPLTVELLVGAAVAILGVLVIVLRPSKRLPKDLLFRGRA